MVLIGQVIERVSSRKEMPMGTKQTRYMTIEQKETRGNLIRI
jgi:hypothetical protein